MDIFSAGLIPFLVLVILIHGYIKDVDVYTSFVEGAIEGLKTTLKIMPYLIAIFVSIGIFKSSKAMDMLIYIFKPIMKIVGLPEEVFPLILLRPISGSGALAIVKSIIENYGPDSYQGRMASIMVGSSETIFYTMAIYFGSIGVKDHRYTLKAAMVSYIASILAAILICNLFF